MLLDLPGKLLSDSTFNDSVRESYFESRTSIM